MKPSLLLCMIRGCESGHRDQIALINRTAASKLTSAFVPCVAMDWLSSSAPITRHDIASQRIAAACIARWTRAREILSWSAVCASGSGVLPANH